MRHFERQFETMQQVFQQFTIRAPSDGMVIYRRDRGGSKRRTGSNINPSDNVVATLPDLSVMLSITWVNEIDISKVKEGQHVRIGVDAFPEKKFTGVITSVANVGEQLANSDAKVFEVIIELNESDLILRPSMTTSNTILINSHSDVVYIPLDAVFNQDSVTFVYTTNNTKQVVVLGESNDTEVIVDLGLTEGEKLHVSIPENSATWRMTGEELIPILKERALEKKRAQEEAERAAIEERRNRANQRGNRQQGGNIRR